MAPQPAVSRQDYVNVRGQATLHSEVVTQLHQGQSVTVLEEISVKNPGPNEPDRWDRIQLPTNATVWVHGDYIDKQNHTVRPRHLNLRGGPGENYSVLGRIERGTAVHVVGDKGYWLKIEAPTNACGFVAAHLLLTGPEALAATTATNPPSASPTQEVASVVLKPSADMNVSVEVKPPAVVEVKTNEVVVIPSAGSTNRSAVATADTNVVVEAGTNFTTVETGAPLLAQPSVGGSTRVVALDTNLVALTDTNLTLPSSLPDVQPPPQEHVKRIVTREGMLRGSTSIQAPSYFALHSLYNGRLIDYVYSSSTNIALQSYKGMKVMVTGEELLDERWPRTPVLTVDKIEIEP